MGQLLPYSFAPLRGIGFVSSALTTTDIDTLDIPEGAQGALVQVTGGNANWTGDDTTAPTNAAGGGMVLLADAEPQWFAAADLPGLQFIAVGSSTFLLVSYYG